MPTDRRGDFLVDADAAEDIDAAFEERSARSRALDKGTRAPITGSKAAWLAVDGKGLDFPGVDTPSDAPERALGDFPLPGENAAAGGPDARAAPDAEPEPMRLGEIAKFEDEQFEALREGLSLD